MRVVDGLAFALQQAKTSNAPEVGAGEDRVV